MRQTEIATATLIEGYIFIIRGQKVMLDEHLAELYRVTTGNLNKAVQRNRSRFPKDFVFRLSRAEAEKLKFQSGRSSLGMEPGKVREHGGRRRSLPNAFTEQGVAMLSSVLRSKRAVAVNVAIMRTFVRLRQFLATNTDLAQRLNELEQRQLEQAVRMDGQAQEIEEVFAAIRQLIAPPDDANRRRIGFPTAQVRE
jgi:hypothetical protein